MIFISNLWKICDTRPWHATHYHLPSSINVFLRRKIKMRKTQNNPRFRRWSYQKDGKIKEIKKKEEKDPCRFLSFIYLIFAPSSGGHWYWPSYPSLERMGNWLCGMKKSLSRMFLLFSECKSHSCWWCGVSICTSFSTLFFHNWHFFTCIF